MGVESMEVEFTHRKLVFLIDDEDYEIVNRLRWTLVTSGEKKYVISCGEKILLHRYLLNLSKGDGKEVDHINGDGLDNRMSNLRVCSRSDNAKNRKMSKHSKVPFKGVQKHGRKFRARITVDGERYTLGSFETPEEANKAYCAFGMEKHKEFFCNRTK